ncbi:hypothetical protein [Flammeovirga agarivorans]|uniref:DUF4384 domain-containing protein n=1 Tax=Flammeovirga agarivorans TaxID=2726742 RepID=A0A7X8SLY0_9BACT|nr:hypothetical protein [Flammeovirga agarivorans]NLR92653.1 hypothetical protein [Flammeovirga agarivorans]
MKLSPFNIKAILSLSLLIILFSNPIFGQKIKKVKAKITEPLTDNITVAEFKQNLLLKAQIQALADEFGTNIASGSDLKIDNSGTDMITLNSSLVKGEWVKTVQVNYTWFLQEQTPYLSCEVEGKGRAITTQKVPIEVELLSCNQQSNCETKQFKENQSLYTTVNSAQEGYINIYMREEDQVYRLFPYSSTSNNEELITKIQSDKKYLFFDSKKASEFNGLTSRDVDELRLSTMGKDRLFNRLYIIYSKTPIQKPVLTTQNGIKTISPEKFQEWITESKTANTTFQDQIIYFSIEQ